MLEIAEGVFEVGGMVHVHLVVTDDGVVLVDTGLPGKSAKVDQALHEVQRSIGDVKTILLTHWHADHVGGAADLHRRSGARVVAHALDAPVVTGAEPAPYTGLLRVAKYVTGTPEPVPVAEVISADGPIQVPGFTAIHTPGHTAGHVSYLLDRSGGVLFAGDAAAGSGSGDKVGLPARAMSADMAAAASSVGRLSALTFDVAVFGHGKAVTAGAVDRFRELAAR